MHLVSLLLFCILYSLTLCSSPDYEFLRAQAIHDDGVDDDDSDYDGIETLSGDEGVNDDGDDDINDDDKDIGTPKKLKGGNDDSAETDDGGGGFVGNNEEDIDGPKKLNLGNDDLDVQQYQLELAAGDLSEFLGSAHHHEPRYFKDLGRRFVPVYPYVERKVKHEKPDHEEILKFVMSSKKSLRDNEVKEIIPIRAPKDVVLAVMKNGTRTYSSKPSDPTEEVIRQYMLRSGDYWDSVWKEEVNPPTILRTNKQHKQAPVDSGPITAKLVPGTKLYNLLASIVKRSPKLVYIISN